MKASSAVHRSMDKVLSLTMKQIPLIPSEARLYPGSIEIFRRRRRRRRQPEVGLKTSISQQWSTG